MKVTMKVTKLPEKQLPKECDAVEAAAIAAAKAVCDPITKWINRQIIKDAAPLVESNGGQVVFDEEDVEVYLPPIENPIRFSLTDENDCGNFAQLAEIFCQAALRGAL